MRNFPFTIVPLVIFNLVIAFSAPGVWDNVVATPVLFSGQEWPLTTGDLMVMLGLLALLAEIVRATTVAHAIANHLLSILVLIAFVIEFVVVAEAANSTFFILTVIALIDVLAGVVVTIRLASRDIAIEGGPYRPLG